MRIPQELPAGHSFFLESMANKPSRTIEEQIELLKQRGMNFHNEQLAYNWLHRISYYRLKGYWWAMQDDFVNHHFEAGWYFEDIIERYEFDKELKIILFRAIETIEIALRTKMIYHMSQSYGGLWYIDPNLFQDSALHAQHLLHLQDEFAKSGEVFVKEYLRNHPNQIVAPNLGYKSDEDPDAWIILEIATFGELSKIYKNIKHQLPEKSQIAKDFGLNIHSDLSSWLEAVAYIRNIIAHHSRLWSRNMVKKPSVISNPRFPWLTTTLTPVEQKRPYYLISAILYLCNALGAGMQLRNDIFQLMKQYQHLPIHRLGFFPKWYEQPVWKS